MPWIADGHSVFRRAPPLGKVMLREFDERREQERRSGAPR